LGLIKRAAGIRAWTNQEFRDLKKFAKDKVPVATISKAMKRTAGALRQKASALGIAIGHQPARMLRNPDQLRRPPQP